MNLHSHQLFACALFVLKFMRLVDVNLPFSHLPTGSHRPVVAAMGDAVVEVTSNARSIARCFVFGYGCSLVAR